MSLGSATVQSNSAGGKRSKVASARDAVALIASRSTVATCGFVGVGVPDAILAALAERYQREEQPYGLSLVFGSSQGDFKERGVNRLALPGLLTRIIGGHFGAAPKLQRMILANELEAYNLPQGVITHLFRDIAAKRPAHVSRVGIGTFADPRLGGGRLNARTERDLVQLSAINDEEVLLYATFPIDVAIVRGTTADESGNITMEREALTLEALPLAMAARNSGGIVIAQVERVVPTGTLHPREVKIPGVLVDRIVVAEAPELHMQTFGEQYSEALAGHLKLPASAQRWKLPDGARRIVARRAAQELRPGSIVNLGIGIPEGVAAVAAQDGLIDDVTLTAEPGVIGGIPNSGLNFGTAINAASIIDQPYQFDFYDGGGIDIAVLGTAEIDAEGNVNVSRFGTRVPGAGGFINITQNAKSLVFAGTFTAGGLDVAINVGRLSIRKEGRHRKFVRAVSHRTFSSAQALANGTPALYITERCVFRLSPEGLVLIEVAPGIDIQRDIIDQMDFAPIIREPLRAMKAEVFV